eukprot:CAMPEP_0113651160 /NCGR_PEP_ID=MMETSP0017_2-20120614/27260_1 /TAXON_ID=2856 /ORGANISM="Cylindrotheca closterium" /LENGTH=312 /DNA_ID=CAMNT_0000563793 /DNA_START=63 /DNA_END=999 /DNA_ORIENTATION=- /assembly_acc=CAM_ASM_000147
MDTANTTVISYDEDVGPNSNSNNDSFLVLSPSSSVTSPSDNAAAANIVTPSSVHEVSKIASYDDEEGDHPLLFQTTSSESQDDDHEHASGVAAAVSKSASGNDDDDASSKLQAVLAKLDKFLDETMMELAYVMIEMEDVEHKHHKPIGDLPSSAGSSMTTEQLEALEKDLRLKIFDILEARQRALQKDQKPAAAMQQSLSLPTIEEQPKTAASPQLKQPPSPPPKLSLAPSSSSNNKNKNMQDLEQQLLEMQNANKALKQQLAQKDVQLNEFSELEKQALQNKKVSSTGFNEYELYLKLEVRDGLKEYACIH